MDDLNPERPIQPPINAIPPQGNAGQENQEPPRWSADSYLPPPPEGENNTEHCRPDQTPWWKHCMEVAAILVGIAVAIIYYRQLTAMQGQLGVMQQTLKDTQASNATATDQVWRAIGNINWAARSMDYSQKDFDNVIKSSDRQSTTSLNATIATFHQEQRAWLSAQMASGYPTAGTPYKINITVVNGGKTPAKHLLIYFTGNFFGRGEKLSYTFSGEPQSLGTDSPGQPLIFTYHSNETTHSEAFITPHKDDIFAVFGAITYRDVFDAKHWLTYCFFADKSDNWAYCQEHNDFGDGQLPPSELK